MKIYGNWMDGTDVMIKKRRFFSTLLLSSQSKKIIMTKFSVEAAVFFVTSFRLKLTNDLSSSQQVFGLKFRRQKNC